MEKLNSKKTEVFEEESELPRSSCSLLGIALLLLFILLLSLLSIFYLKTRFNFTLKKPAFDLALQNDKNLKSTGNLNVSGENAIIKLNDEDITSQLKYDTFPLKKAKAQIKPDGIIISGKTGDNILSLSVSFVLLPVLENDKISYKISDIKSSGVAAPKIITDQINKSFADSAPNLSPELSRISIQKIELADGLLTITGIRK